MNWLTPQSGLILAAAVIPPLIMLYFLKLRRQPQSMPSTLLWKRSVEDLRANAPFQRLRKSLLLFLQLLALILLAMSIMQPQIQGSAPRGGKTVILVDNSASMTTTDAGEDASRLDQAKRLASERIEAMYSRGLFGGDVGETMIISFAEPERSEVMARFTDSKQTLLGAIERIQPTHGRTSLQQALTLARAYTTTVDPEMAGRPIDDPARLELYSDGNIQDLDEQVLRGETLDFYPVGTTTADNIGVTTVSVERPYDRPTSVEVFAAMRNYSEEERTLDVQLSVDDVALYVETVVIEAARRDENGVLAPGQNNLVFTPFEQPQDVVIEVAILREDNLLADNVAAIVVPPPKQLSVALVSRGGTVYLNVLRGMALKSHKLYTPEQYEQRVQAEEFPEYDVVIFDDYAPDDAALMPAGRYLCFGKTPPLEGLNDYGEGARQVVLTARDEHPALRFVSFDTIFISKSRLIEPADDIQVIAEGSTAPVIVGISRGPMQVMYVTFDALTTLWPLDRGFVNFVVNAVDYLGHAGDALSNRSYSPGEPITTRINENATNVTLRTPDGQIARPIVSEGGQVTWGPTRLAGIHLLSWNVPEMTEEMSRPIAVNLNGMAEGQIAATTSIEIGEKQIEGLDGDATGYTPLWPWAIALCLLVLTIEWWVYNRLTYV